jgi:hypothetical protein
MPHHCQQPFSSYVPLAAPIATPWACPSSCTTAGFGLCRLFPKCKLNASQWFWVLGKSMQSWLCTYFWPLSHTYATVHAPALIQSVPCSLPGTHHRPGAHGRRLSPAVPRRPTALDPSRPKQRQPGAPSRTLLLRVARAHPVRTRGVRTTRSKRGSAT